MKRKVNIPIEKINKFRRRNHIRRLSLFGSILRRDFRASSDLDVLVEFNRGHVPGLAFFRMQDELSKIFRRPVDLNTPHFLSLYFRDQVQAEAQIVYGEG